VLWHRVCLLNFCARTRQVFSWVFTFIVVSCIARRVCRSFVCCGKAFVSQRLFRGQNVTNLRAALARLPHTPSCGRFLYLLVGSTGCGGNARGFEEGIKKLVYRAGEGIFFGNGFHRVCLTLLDDFHGALSLCDVCLLVRVLFWDSQCRVVQFLCRFVLLLIKEALSSLRADSSELVSQAGLFVARLAQDSHGTAD